MSKLLYATMLLIILGLASGQLALSQTAEMKQMQKDSSKIHKDSVAKDTIPPNVPLAAHGSISNKFKPYSTITKRDLLTMHYTGFADILSAKLPAFPLSLGSEGQLNSISLFGGSRSGLALQFNGRQIAQADFGYTNPEMIAPEFLESAEIFVGSSAVILSDNASNALVNIKEIKYNTSRPYTRLWYAQGDYDYVAADGVFSQNFSKNWNYTFGFRRIGNTGRFKGNQMDAWNVRSLLRWNASASTNFSLVHVFTNHGTQENGGVNRALSSKLGDNLSAVPMYNYFEDRVFRHDLTLAMTSLIAGDSSSIFNATAYFSHTENERNYPEIVFAKQSDTISREFYTSRQVGLSAAWELSLDNVLGLRTGGELYYTNLDKSFFTQEFKGMNLSAYALGQFRPLQSVEFTGGARWMQRDNRTALAFGAGSRIRFGESAELFADFSFSERLPSPAENISLKKEAISLMIAEFAYSAQSLKISLGGFARRIENPVVYNFDSIGTVPVAAVAVSGASRACFGAFATTEWQVTRAIFAKAWAQSYFSQIDGNDSGLLPPLYAGLSSYYEILRGESMLRLGFDFKAIAPFKGERFYPIARNTQTNELESQFITNGLDLVATARLGNAFLRISWMNVMNQVFYYVPYYPMSEQSFKLSVSWNFLN